MLEKWGQQLNPNISKAADIAGSDSIEEAESNEAYHVLNLPQGGWIIISADDVAYPVIAFSSTGSYSDQEHPVQFDEWMSNVRKEISTAINKNFQALADPVADSAAESVAIKISTAWQRFNVDQDLFSTQQTYQKSADASVSVGPLLTTTWNQGTYYNASCPVDVDGPDGHVWAGCAATAMAQVMKYHNHPTTGSGSHPYIDDSYGDQFVNFGATTYNWNSMPNALSSYNDAVATLLYHAGVSINTNYGIDGSGAIPSTVAYALKTYFKYSSSLYFAKKSSYTTNEWTALLQTELNNHRPVVYAGYGIYEGKNIGHGFVCDGFKDSDFFHFNWGWSGNSDGYFYLNNLTPSSYNFSSYQAAIIGVTPALPVQGQISP